MGGESGIGAERGCANAESFKEVQHEGHGSDKEESECVSRQRKVPLQFLEYLRLHPGLDVKETLSYLDNVKPIIRVKFEGDSQLMVDLVSGSPSRKEELGPAALFMRKFHTYFTSFSGRERIHRVLQMITDLGSYFQKI